MFVKSTKGKKEKLTFWERGNTGIDLFIPGHHRVASGFVILDVLVKTKKVINLNEVFFFGKRIGCPNRFWRWC